MLEKVFCVFDSAEVLIGVIQQKVQVSKDQLSELRTLVAPTGCKLRICDLDVAENEIETVKILTEMVTE